jgi:hypothetical protein
MPAFSMLTPFTVLSWYASDEPQPTSSLNAIYHAADLLVFRSD